MSARPLRAALVALVALVAALCVPAAGAHPDSPHFTFDSVQLLVHGSAGDAAESSAGRVRGAPRVANQIIGNSTATKVECTGNGTSGKRVQVMYVRDSETADGYADNKAAIGAWAVAGDRIFRESAAKTQGVHRIRFVHDEFCNLSILNVVVDDPDDLEVDDLDPIRELVEDLGYDAPNRKYLMFVDNETDTMCGRGSTPADDSGDQDNRANGLPNGVAGYTRIDFDNAGCNPEDWILAHELSHNLGAVQDSAPDSNSTGHCNDNYDRLCQDDGAGTLIVDPSCPNSVADERLLDCDNDSYFHARPATGTYLDTNWNIARSDFLASEPGSLWGFVRADDPAAASYTPSLAHQANSTNGTNTVVRTARGVYEVTFANLAIYGDKSGSAQVTAKGAAGEHCKVSSWSSDGGADETVTVRCFDAAGATVDAQFDASFIRPITTSGDFAYLLAEQETSGSYTPSTPHQFNSTGALNTITRASAGVYTVVLPNLSSFGGTVKVTAFGAGSDYCKAESWTPSGSDEVVQVRCYDASGAAVDEEFLLTYAYDLSVVASEGTSASVRAADADRALASSYTPDLAYQHNSDGGDNTVVRNGTGDYTVTLPGLGATVSGAEQGTVHVTAYHTTTKRCQVESWVSTYAPFGVDSDIKVDVLCHTSSGTPSNAKFVLQFTR